MLREEKNLKDLGKDSIKDISSVPAPYQATGFGSGSYTKTNKLITALYMVTDIIDKDEPLRNKLRTLGADIISDIHSAPSNICSKISEIMSFLDIAFAINIISEMNYSILRKEFLQLDQSIKESTDNGKNQINLAEFFNEELPAPQGHYQNLSARQAGIEQHSSTSIGVQKGSTLLKALSNRINPKARPNTLGLALHTKNFDILKKQRRNEISSLIQKKGGNATITDIKNGAYGSLISCSEKTLQRELISMVKDGVLNKTGEKRWSRYFIK